MRIKLFTFLFLGLLSIQLRAQVTIGSGLEPKKGNLLELKENDNTGNTANASKGLGLPRVELKGIDTLTIDMDTEKDKYIGTTVYNTSRTGGLDFAPYYWDGTTWIKIMGNNDMVNIYNSDGKLTSDREIDLDNKKVVFSKGYVGMGTSAPTTKLHISGGNSFRYEDGNQQQGRVLQSDSQGNAIWASLDTEKNNVEVYGGQAKIPPHDRIINDWNNHNNSSYDTGDWIILSKTSYSKEIIQGRTRPFALSSIKPSRMKIVYEYTGSVFNLNKVYPMLTVGNNSNYPDIFTISFIGIENVNGKTRLSVSIARVDNIGIGTNDNNSDWAGSFLLNILIAVERRN